MGVITLNAESTHDEANPFKNLATRLAKYNIDDLLSTVGGLQLLPENASRVTRLEALSHSVASLPANSGPNISTGGLRKICTDSALQALAHYEDPAENQFAEEFTFFGGSYLVLPGIAQAGEFMLANLCKAIFLDPDESLPEAFRAHALRVVSSALHLMNAVAEKVGIRRGTAPSSDQYQEIVVPGAATLQKLKNAVRFTKAEVGALLTSAKLPADALNRLICKTGDINLDQYDVVNGPLLWRPFVDCNGAIILVIPGMVVSAIRQALLQLAYEANLQADLAGVYSKAVWQDVRQSLSFTRNMPFAHRPSGPPNIPGAVDGFFSLDHDKVLYCLLITDPLTRAADSDPFGFWTNDALENLIQKRIAEVERDVFSVNPAPDDLFIVVTFQGLGGTAAFGLEHTPARSHSIALPAEALRTISLLEGGDPLALFNFARARDKVRQRTKLMTSNVLDEFYLYRKNEYSFYFSDQVPPNVIFIPPGDSLNLQMEVARQRDFHASQMADGSTVEVTSLHGTASIPIYSPVADLGERVRLVVEGLPVAVWVAGPDNISSGEDHKSYALFADAISFWIWQFTPFLEPLLRFLELKRPIEIKMMLPSQETWQLPLRYKINTGKPPVEVKTYPSRNLIEVTVNAELIPLLRTADNVGERELMRNILVAFSQLISESRRKALLPAALEKALNSIAPVGLKKMLLLFDSTRTPEIDGRGIPRYRSLQKVWVNDHLDRIGEYLVRETGFKVGDIDPEQRTSALNKAAAYCFSQMERIAATLSPKGLLRFAVAYSEAVHHEQTMNRLTIPTRLACFQSDPDMIEQLGKRIPELANAGLASRLLVEYVVAQPPSGLRPISLDLYDEMRAWSYHCLNYAMMSDAVHFGIEEYKLSLLPSQRLGIDGTARKSAMSGHIRAFALDQIGAAPENFKRQWEPPKHAERGELFRTELDAATTEEFGLPLSELLELMELGISLGQKSAPGVASLSDEQFLKEAAKALKRSEDNIKVALNLLSLGPRASFWTSPDGYIKADLYPWRYNRPLSYMRRPFLRHACDGETQIVWGLRHLRAAQNFLVDQCTSGKLKAKTPRMRSFMNGLLNVQGELFNKNVFTFFDALGGLSVKKGVKKIGHLRELQDHLGDIDVLVGDIQRNRILVIECKDLSVARTPYEMAKEFIELFMGSGGKKSIIDKHQARTTWAKSNADAIIAFLKLNPSKRWKILPLIVVDQPLMASYIRESPIQILSLEELKRFWPEIRRI